MYPGQARSRSKAVSPVLVVRRRVWSSIVIYSSNQWSEIKSGELVPSNHLRLNVTGKRSRVWTELLGPPTGSPARVVGPTLVSMADNPAPT